MKKRCPKCSSEMIHNESHFYCRLCGYSEEIIVKLCPCCKQFKLASEFQEYGKLEVCKNCIEDFHFMKVKHY